MSSIHESLEVDPIFAQEIAQATKVYYDDVLKYTELGDEGLAKAIGNRALQVAAETCSNLEGRADIEVPRELENVMSLFSDAVKNYSQGEPLIKYSRNTYYQIFMAIINNEIKPHTGARNQIAEIAAFNVIKSALRNVHHGDGPVTNLFDLLFNRTNGRTLITEIPENEAESDGIFASDVSVSRISDALESKNDKLVVTSCRYYDRLGGVYVDESLRLFGTNLSENGVAGVIVYNQFTLTDTYSGDQDRYRSVRIAFLPVWIIDRLRELKKSSVYTSD